MPQARISVLIALVVVAAAILTGRLVQLQMIEHDRHAQRAETVRMRKILVPGRRATILDRQGRVLAVDEPRWDLHLNYWLFTEPENILARIEYRGGVPGFTPAETAQLLAILQPLAAKKADRHVSRPKRFRETWPGRMHPLVRREIEATVVQLAGILATPIEPMRAHLQRIEAEVNALLAEKTQKETEQYLTIVRLGSNVGHWDDLAREERRRERNAVAWRYQTNPLIFAQDLDRRRVETVVELDRVFCGMSFEPRAHRRYPLGATLSHVLGYLREVDRIGFTPASGESDSPLNSPHFRAILQRAIADVGDEFVSAHFRSEEYFERAFRWRLMNCPSGVVGLERFYDGRLQGRFGASVVERDVHARLQRKIDEVQPAASPDVRLSVDVAVQQAAEQALAEIFARTECPGAAVMIDARTGEILAIASFPNFDLNRLMGRSADDRAYMHDLFANGDEHRQPMFNRAVHATVPPGSVFKIITGIAAAESGVTRGPDFYGTCPCTGVWQGRGRVGFSRGFTCHGGQGCGNLSLVTALERSCNIYFHDVADRMGYARLRDWSEKFGLGEKTGVDFSEFDPWRTSRDGRLDNRFYPVSPATRAEAALNGIGQGKMLVTPLQIARVMAGVAMEGALPTPHLLRGEGEFAPTYVADVRPEVWQATKEGLRRVVVGAQGTARDIRDLRRFRAAGKTGTAQTGRKVDGRDLHYAWFSGYAPAEAPVVAFAVYVEDTTDYGGTIAAPVAVKMLEALAQTDDYRTHFAPPNHHPER